MPNSRHDGLTPPEEDLGELQAQAKKIDEARAIRAAELERQRAEVEAAAKVEREKAERAILRAQQEREHVKSVLKFQQMARETGPVTRVTLSTEGATIDYPNGQPSSPREFNATVRCPHLGLP